LQSFDYVNVGDGLPLAPIIDVKITPPTWLDKIGDDLSIMGFGAQSAYADFATLATISIVRHSIAKS